ncbi:GNAT family N-acetyltransferase [Streptomyces sp. NPDC049040]|uniref:GNAT family N-acetyltransferase n=1 Tax=Streptomyces sp. NPDC049040 TaxID=3365593 RepID=UPI00372329D6
MRSSLRLEKITPENVDAACGVKVGAEQERFVAPVVRSLADAYAHGEAAWPRLVFDGDEPVGFVMGGFDPLSPVDAFRCGIWRLNIAEGRQGQGYGRFAVEAVGAEARRRGQRRMTVLWVPGDDGPAGFYRQLGFRPTGEELQGQVVGELSL